jgi:RNA polymerase primary sigma factor
MFTLQNQTVQLSLEEMVDNDRIPSEIEKALDTLTPREKKILSLRFGLDGNEAHTLEQCANQFDVNRERIRQIEAKALIKLRHRSRSWHLQELRNAEIEHVVNE